MDLSPSSEGVGRSTAALEIADKYPDHVETTGGVGETARVA